jgi:hypothetical protein
LEAVGVAKGGTTAAAFFGLSSSLKRKLFDIKEKEKIKRRKTWRKGSHILTSQVTRRYQSWNPWKSLAPAVHLLD